MNKYACAIVAVARHTTSNIRIKAVVVHAISLAEALARAKEIALDEYNINQYYNHNVSAVLIKD